MARSRAMLLAAAAIVAAPGAARAQAADPAAMEARLKQLEEAVAALRAELDAARAQAARTEASVIAQGAATKATEVRIAAMEGKPAAPAEGFRVGGMNVKIGGFIKTVANSTTYSGGKIAPLALGRDFYLPQQIPIGGVRPTTENDFSAKQTRLFLALSGDVGRHVLKGYVETDFQTAAGTQGTERTTNGYDLALRRAYIQFDNLLIGQDWSTFQYVAALPETTDFIGPTEGSVFVRQPLIRYSLKLSKAATLHLAIENPQTSTATTASPTLIENDDNHLPDFVSRLNYAASFGELSLAGAVFQLRAENGVQRDAQIGWGLSTAGKIPFGAGKRYDLRFMASYGQGLGRYLGLNFAPDAILEPATGKLLLTENFAAFAAVRVPWSTALRSSVMFGYQSAGYPTGLAPGTFNAFNRQAWSGAANLFWSPVKGFDLGIEYRHGERALVSGASGRLDRVEIAGKYSF